MARYQRAWRLRLEHARLPRYALLSRIADGGAAGAARTYAAPEAVVRAPVRGSRARGAADGGRRGSGAAGRGGSAAPRRVPHGVGPAGMAVRRGRRPAREARADAASAEHGLLPVPPARELRAGAADAAT